MENDLSPYELRVLRQMATGGDEDLICGAAMWAALESMLRADLVRKTAEQGGIAYDVTPAGRALVRSRDAELTPGHRTLVSELADKGFLPGDESGANINAGKLTEAKNG
jgi:hypothetical protein